MPEPKIYRGLMSDRVAARQPEPAPPEPAAPPPLRKRPMLNDGGPRAPVVPRMSGAMQPGEHSPGAGVDWRIVGGVLGALALVLLGIVAAGRPVPMGATPPPPMEAPAATIAALPADPGLPVAPAAAPAEQAPAAAPPASEGSFAPIDCTAPANESERQACASRSAPAPAPAAPAPAPRVQAVAPAAAPPAQAPLPGGPPSDLVPIPSEAGYLAPAAEAPAPTAGAYSCTEVTAAGATCRGSRRP
jgi:hypothetical protein